MAIYQFSISILPNDFNGDDYDGNVWINSRLNNQDFICAIMGRLEDVFESSNPYPKTFLYGKEEGVLVNVILDSEGLLQLIYIRVHMKYFDEVKRELVALENIFGEWDVFGWTDNETKIQVKAEQILKEAKKSKSFKFVSDPEKFLEDEDNHIR